MVKRQNETVRATELHHSGNAADVECIRRIAAGDPESIVVLYDRHARAMYSLAFRILHTEADAKDVVHEVFMQVCRDAGREAASQGVVSAWLLALVRNHAIDRWRALRTHRAIESPVTGDPWSPPSAATPDPAYETSKLDASERVRDAFRSLPDLDRIALEMTYFEGLRHQEIASRLEQPVDTVKSRVRLALLKLRAALTWEVR